MADIFTPGMENWLDELNNLAKGQLLPIQPDWNAAPNSLKAIANKPTLAAVATSGSKADVGLSKVDNTSDAEKPVSTLQQATFALKTSLGPRNRVDNSNFRVNQLGVSGTVTLAPGAYGHDRWKAGAGGCTYTFTGSQAIITLNITAGSLVQVIDGTMGLQGDGDYVASWTGTSKGRFGSSAYAASGFTIGLQGDTNPPLEFGIGTLSRVQLELGSTPTPYEVKHYDDDYERCRLYFARDTFGNNAVVGVGQAWTSGKAFVLVPSGRTRAVPAVTTSGILARLGGEVVGAPVGISWSPSGVYFSVVWSATPFNVGDSVMLAAQGTFTIDRNANL